MAESLWGREFLKVGPPTVIFKAERSDTSLMAKKRSRRFPRNMRVVQISSSSAIGALAAADVVVNAVTNTASGKMRFTSVTARYGVSGGTSPEGPVIFGLAHSDYTAAEIEECLEAGGSIDLGDKIAREQANRLVRRIGIIDMDPNAIFNDGKPVKTKLNWLMAVGDQLSLWIFNKDQVTLTTGGLLTIDGKLVIVDV